MKTLMMIFTAIVVLPLVSFADDNGSGNDRCRDEKIKYACKCIWSGDLAELNYYSIEKSTGEVTLVKNLDAFGSGELAERMANCKEAKESRLACTTL
jgi:hypothetical protein